ncbi:MAG: hypothetical protein SFX19_10205 [Alphaproteobacteria bacterium]|nr:hypothetical protein [Alphaproteobacteria bacterium]
MDAQTLLIILQGLLTLLVLIIGAVVKSAARDLKEVEKAAGENAIGLAKYQLHVSENYATKNDLNAARTETNESLRRLHDRLDNMDENFDEKMTEVSRDIKSLLKRP